MSSVININGKDYPFHISPYNAEKMQKKVMSENNIENVKLYVELIHQGMLDARLSMPFVKKFYLIPSKKVLSRIVPIEDMLKFVNLAMAFVNIGEEEIEDSPKSQPKS